ncbi:hypothetical protein EV200_11196 [Pedobacter psychrotolerans]|uniref:Uncharacterized protein n=1 Tax=Pedobacter psychrotolerans TaxID=1843235 RepID=A0A4R2H1Z4_9SPHI|nr:hypothetical protein EV200_11196 [Pedobacter psychrotolerans]
MTPYKFVILRSTLLSLNKIQEKPEVSGHFEEGIYLSSPDLWKVIKKR